MPMRAGHEVQPPVAQLSVPPTHPHDAEPSHPAG
jgi:hypothetical protein